MTTPAEDAVTLIKGWRSVWASHNETRLVAFADIVLQALLAAQEAAKAEERAAVVAWHERQATSLNLSAFATLRELAAVHTHAATMIENGDHLTKKEAG